MDKHSPMPWRVKQNSELSNWLVIRPDKTVVCAAWREADAAFIVEAVNGVEATRELQRKLLGWSIERDRLRDIMRGLVAILETITLEDHEIELLDEARKAIKEDEP